MVKYSVLADDVRAYRQKVYRGDLHGFETFEEQDFEQGMRQNAISWRAANNGGVLDFQEFAALIRAREKGPHTDLELRGRFASIDVDGSGTIELHEFLAFALRDALLRSSQRVLDLFHKWNRDGRGSLAREDVGKDLLVLATSASEVAKAAASA